MAGLVDRLLQNARAYVHDFMDKHLPGAPPAWEQPQAPDDSAYTATEPPPSARPADAPGGLPYSAELGRCYAMFDLPFATPLEQVTRRWKAYLRKCHPDLHAGNAAQQAEATELTQQLNGAYDKIKTAWERHRQ